MLQHAGVRAVLVGGAAADQRDAVRLEAIGALRCLSCAAENQVRMRHHAGVQAALLGGAAAGEPDAVRLDAIGALRNLSCAVENMVPMQRHAGLQAALVSGAAVGQPEAVRSEAIGALRNLFGTALTHGNVYDRQPSCPRPPPDVIAGLGSPQGLPREEVQVRSCNVIVFVC
jgi:hypothetical protein